MIWLLVLNAVIVLGIRRADDRADHVMLRVCPCIVDSGVGSWIPPSPAF